MSRVVPTMNIDPAGALKQLDEMQALANELKPQTPAGRNQVMQAKTIASQYRTRIEAQQQSLADLEKKIIDNPDDVPAIGQFLTKVQLELGPLVRSKPDEAATKLEAAKEVLNKVRETAKNEATKRQLDNFGRTIASLEKSIEAGKKLTELIGKDAAPLKAETWVNGSPLTDGDLKGKVVFLDFWAVWCGPCIATFPHLREWNEKYADKGLVMIGLTNYYNYQWDEATKKASRSTDKVSHEDELEMLAKFAESYDLKHRFALEADRSLSEYYGVTGIPHVVVIDQQGKIRMMKVGSGEANAKEIGALLAQLLEPKTTGGQ
jgi:thiol-disulfide isomerase/thioredoxin